jgi:hypothetical protein
MSGHILGRRLMETLADWLLRTGWKYRREEKDLVAKEIRNFKTKIYKRRLI